MDHCSSTAAWTGVEQPTRAAACVILIRVLMAASSRARGPEGTDSPMSPSPPRPSIDSCGIPGAPLQWAPLSPLGIWGSPDLMDTSKTWEDPTRGGVMTSIAIQAVVVVATVNVVTLIGGGRGQQHKLNRSEKHGYQ
jgi:hypothetical protein